MRGLPLILFSVILCWSTSTFAEISERRQFQLDSVSTNIPKPIRQNFDSVHAFLHKYGSNDEERVWLFYGYIGTHFKYDQKRKKEGRDAPVYSPQYTAQRRSGVCRDFADVFRLLCDKSNIPCFSVTGRTDQGFIPVFLEKAGYICTFQFKRVVGLHAWNVVKVNGQWQLMDPTWTSVKKTVKLPVYDPKTKMNTTVQVRSVDRAYYNADPVFMMKSHAPFHPAFLLSANVPTYRSTTRKPARHKTYRNSYDFQAAVDSLFNSKKPFFSKTYYSSCMSYSKNCDIYYKYRMELALPFQKSGKYNKPTIADYDKALLEAKALTDTIRNTLGLSYYGYYKKFETELDKKRTRLIKKQLQAEAAGRKK